MSREDVLQIKKRLSELRVLRNKERSVLYDRENMLVRRIKPAFGDDLEKLLTHIDEFSDDSPVWLKMKHIADHFSAINFSIPDKVAGIKEKDREESLREDFRRKVKPEKYIAKLAINLANDCNLRCAYCYANKGVYKTPQRALMSLDILETSIRRFAERFDYIESIQFMGGEPSMHPEGIVKTAQVFQQMVDEGKLISVPVLGMVSNGVGYTKRFLEIVKKYNCDITISLDGPKEIHDQVRCRASGRGSYDDIRRNLNKLEDIGRKLGFEATYSRKHLEGGMTLIDLCKWFFNEFNVRSLHGPVVSDNENTASSNLGLTVAEKTAQYNAVTEWGLDNLVKGEFLMHGFTGRILRSFTEKSKNTFYCPAGVSQLTVDAKGNVCPCWIFTDEQALYMGNVNKDDFLGVEAISVIQTITQNDLRHHPECQKCWVQPVCFGCIGADYNTTKKLDVKTECEQMRSMLTTFLLKASEVFPKLHQQGGFKQKEDSSDIKSRVKSDLTKLPFLNI